MTEHNQPSGKYEASPSPVYQRAARFAGERPAGLAYLRVRDVLFRADCDLSVYRLQLARRWHVAVLGVPPPTEVDQQLRLILAAGEATTLPSDVLALLLARRAEQRRPGRWVERHHEPGERL